jgi:hypothetical protein
MVPIVGEIPGTFDCQPFKGALEEIALIQMSVKIPHVVEGVKTKNPTPSTRGGAAQFLFVTVTEF